MQHKPGRRTFLQLAGGVGALSMLDRSAGGAVLPRPDILLVMPDQMRGDCISILGHPAARTPRLDELARRGVLFRRAYSTVPSCIPARYALLTGLSAQTSGVVGFKAKPIATPTLPALLGDAGYRTALVGRYMHQLPSSGACGYQQEVLGSTHVDDDDYDTYLKQAAPASGGIRQLVKDHGLTYNHWQAAPWPLDDDLHPTAWIVRHAREVVRQSPSDAPLLLTASFYAPHPPLFPPAKYFREGGGPEVPTARGDWVDWSSITPEGDRHGHRVLLEGETLRLAQAGYFGLIEHLDTEAGKLVDDFIARSQEADRPWVVLVTSDHGEMLGDHGYFRKCQPYEGSANIPFVIAGDARLGLASGSRSNVPVCLEDVMPTLLGLAGVPVPAAVDGVDLGPNLRGSEETARPWRHFEHAPCYSLEQGFHALTDGRWKYIWRPHTGTEQLFDLVADPKEETDLAAKPEGGQELARWRARMVERLASRPEGFCEDGKLVPGRTYEPLNAGTLGIG